MEEIINMTTTTKILYVVIFLACSGESKCDGGPKNVMVDQAGFR